jgi:hypothetical protein
MIGRGDVDLAEGGGSLRRMHPAAGRIGFCDKTPRAPAAPARYAPRVTESAREESQHV